MLQIKQATLISILFRENLIVQEINNPPPHSIPFTETEAINPRIRSHFQATQKELNGTRRRRNCTTIHSLRRLILSRNHTSDGGKDNAEWELTCLPVKVSHSSSPFMKNPIQSATINVFLSILCFAFHFRSSLFTSSPAKVPSGDPREMEVEDIPQRTQWQFVV